MKTLSLVILLVFFFASCKKPQPEIEKDLLILPSTASSLAQAAATSCGKGELGACYSLGLYYFLGTETPKDFEKTKNIWEAACARGHARSCQDVHDYFDETPLEPKIANKISLLLKNPEAVTSLDLSHQKLKRIPHEVFLFPNLVKLELGHNLIRVVPSEIGNFSQLKYLSLSGNNIQNFPPEISRLSQLTVLDMSETCLSSEMINQLNALPQLKELRLNHCASGIPSNLSQLKTIEHLELSGGGSNPDTRVLFKILAELPRLKELDLSSLALKKLASNIGDLSQLTYLKLSYNDFRILPEEFKKLTKLETLYIGLERTLDDELIKNQMFPPQIFELPQLKFLWVNATLLSVPDRFDQLPLLEELHLTLPIKILPPSVATLQNLKVLNVANCQLEEISQALEKMPRLLALDVSYNWGLSEKITEFLQNTSLTQLETLELAGMNFGSIGFPQEITRFKKLKFLNISMNQLTGIPDEIKKLSQLENLNFSQNQIDQLPVWFYDLKNLKRVSAYANKLPPEEYVKLRNYFSQQ